MGAQKHCVIYKIAGLTDQQLSTYSTMFTSSRVAIVLSVFGVCSAQIAGLGPDSGAQVSIVGVGEVNTTYEFVGTLSGIVATETLVLGATDASFTVVVPAASLTAGGECGINNGIALCTDVVNSFTITASVTLADLNLPTAVGGGTTGGGGASEGLSPTTPATGTGAGASTPSASSGGDSTPSTSDAMGSHANHSTILVVIMGICAGIRIL
ncbi:hypothetical protein BD410DRAFT_796962 [Rickenella mellea]|uniref:Uncharacterized protein n=1 Tax=Rickenella mellea TaxID=50990 RepID=A0A4Y7PI96_9AGAM|nr:hypothetical protein BD410DRAFT_796962 [Rickenella mellea]